MLCYFWTYPSPRSVCADSLCLFVLSSHSAMIAVNSCGAGEPRAPHAMFWNQSTLLSTNLRERIDGSGDSRKRRRDSRVTRPLSLGQEAT